MRTINFSDARNNLKSVLDRVAADADMTLITRRDAEAIVVMSLSTFERWRETVYLLSDSEHAKRLMESVAELDEGKGQVQELIYPPRRRRVEEPSVQYCVSTHQMVSHSLCETADCA